MNMMMGVRTDKPTVKIRMDTSKAMAILGFSSSQTFEQTGTGQIQSAFMWRVHQLETAPEDRFAYTRTTRRDQLRRVNEAYQHLTRKVKGLSGRSMAENWGAIGGKSKVLATLKILPKSGLMKTPVDKSGIIVSDVEARKEKDDVIQKAVMALKEAEAAVEAATRLNDDILNDLDEEDEDDEGGDWVLGEDAELAAASSILEKEKEGGELGEKEIHRWKANSESRDYLKPASEAEEKEDSPKTKKKKNDEKAAASSTRIGGKETSEETTSSSSTDRRQQRMEKQQQQQEKPPRSPKGERRRRRTRRRSRAEGEGGGEGGEGEQEEEGDGGRSRCRRGHEDIDGRSSSPPLLLLSSRLAAFPISKSSNSLFVPNSSTSTSISSTSSPKLPTSPTSTSSAAARRKKMNSIAVWVKNGAPPPAVVMGSRKTSFKTSRASSATQFSTAKANNKSRLPDKVGRRAAAAILNPEGGNGGGGGGNGRLSPLAASYSSGSRSDLRGGEITQLRKALSAMNLDSGGGSSSSSSAATTSHFRSSRRNGRLR